MIFIPLISFCCLISLARTSNTILNRYVECGQTCFAPDFSGIILSCSPFTVMLTVDLLYIVFIMFKYIPFIP